MNVRSWFFTLGGAMILLLLMHGFGPFYSSSQNVIAYEASSSTNFFLHGGGLDSIAKRSSSSTSFIEYAAGGQAIIGRASSSTNFISRMGIIEPMFRTFQAGAATLTLTINSGGVVGFGSTITGQRKTATTNLKVTQTGATSINITAGRQRAITNVTLASNATPLITANQISDTAGGINVFDGLSPCSATAIWPAATGVSSGLGFVLWKDSNSSKNTTCWGTGTTETGSLNKYAALQASNSASSFITISSSLPTTLYASVGYSFEISATQKATLYNGAVIFTATVAP